MSPEHDLHHRLRTGDLRIVGRFAAASNLTLLAELDDGTACVYKPVSGERPLWDFPAGTLHRRERATAVVGELLGWALVPPTVLREDGPMGPGVCQIFIDAAGPAQVDLLPADDVPTGWLVVAHGEGERGEQVALVHRDSAALRRLALLDVVVNNADRKGGHILTDTHGAVWGIDHGLSFHVEDKLRSVLWGFAGRAIGDDEAAGLHRLAGQWDGAVAALTGLVSPVEIAAAQQRLAALLGSGRYPLPAAGWPRLPWPPL